MPSTSTASWMGIGGNTVTFATPSTWTLGLGGIQDDALEGLSAFLFDNDNARATVRLTPVDGGTVWTANITLSVHTVGIGGNTVTFATPSTWTLGLGGIQDDALEGLSAFLFDNDNARATVRLTPVDGGTVWTANITLSATKIGGTAGNTPADFDVTLAVQGKPTRAPATP